MTGMLNANQRSPLRDQSQLPYPERPKDEIDLADLLRSLWTNRLLIAAIMLTALLSAMVYIFVVPTVYRSTSVYTLPAIQQVRGMVSWELETYPVTPEMVFEEFKAKLGSDQVRLAFFEQQILSSEQKARLDENALIQEYQGFLRRLEVKPSGPKDTVRTVTVSFEGDNPIVAAEKLRNFVSVANQAALQALKQNFEAVRDSKLAELKSRIDALKFEAQRHREMRLQELEEALTVAQSLDLKESRLMTPSFGTASLPNGEGEVPRLLDPPLYWLGTNELKAQIAAIKSANYAFYHAPELPKLESQYRHVRAAHVVTEGGLAYTEQQAPLPDFNPVRPQRGLAVALALVAGFLIGVMIALIRSSITRAIPKDISVN